MRADRSLAFSCIAAVLLLSAPADAQSRRPIRFDRLSLEQGLSQSGVNRILQDSRGFIWLATEDGLNRYDGVGFKVYRHEPSNPASLPSSFVRDLAEDGAGDLWIATMSGLATLQRTTDRVSVFEPLADKHLYTLCMDAAHGVLWIGMRDSGVYRLDLPSRKLTRLSHDPAVTSSLMDDRIYALALDRAGRLWVGTDGGLDRLDPGSTAFVHFTADPASPATLSDAKVRAIVEDDTGAIWVGTSTGGLNRLGRDGRFERFRHDPKVPSSLAHDNVRALLHDADGRLWVGTGNGLDLFDPSRTSFTHYAADPKDPTGLANGEIISLAQDRGGVIWVGTTLGGVHKWNPLSWQFGHVTADPDDPHALRSPGVVAFSEDRAGRLWIGTFDAGIYVMDRGTGEMTAYRHDDRNPRSLASDKVRAIHHDRHGRLWVGTKDAGLDLFDPATGVFEHHRADPTKPEGLSANSITTILEDHQGFLWLGTYGGGLDRFDPTTRLVQQVRNDPKDSNSLSGDRVSSVLEAADGKVWVGTFEKGIALLDPHTGRCARLPHRPGDTGSLSSDRVNTLFLDASGELWVGTDAGLNHFDPETRQFRAYTTRDGLSNDVVYGILSDRQGRLWISTVNGLSRFDPRTGQFRNYGVSDGLQATEFNFGAFHQSPSGELFFGGVNGFNAFYPDRLREVTQPPAVVLTAVTVGHRPLEGPADQLREVRLGFRDRVLELDFAALDFTAPRRNSFSYRLEGFDPEWVPISGRQSVTYTNLSPGRYTFRLKGANSDGRWTDQPLAVGIVVDAAPWKSRSAFAGYAVVILAAVLGVVQAQRRKLQRKAEYARVLEQRVQERTRELSERQQELERVNRELAQASVTDSLTGLANRRFLADYIEREVAVLHRRYRRAGEGTFPNEMFDLAFLMIDIDNFKVVNDSAGHAAGDAVLRQLRDLLLSVSRSSDIVVRWGGDEFLLVARDQSSEGLAELSERIRCAVEQRVFEVGEGRVLRATCSIGFACYPFFREQLDALSWEQVVSVADRALYVAKASGRNAWVGIHPGLAALPIQGLFGAICHGVQQLVVDGTLRVSSSLGTSRPLVWEVPREAVVASAS